jgi:hypothetical protein
MSTYHGRAGYVTLGDDAGAADDAVGYVTAWSYEQTAPTSDYTSMGDTAKTYKLGFPNGSGTVDCYWDANDTDGQAALWTALGAGSSVTLNLFTYVASAGAPADGDIMWQGSVVITSLE